MVVNQGAVFQGDVLGGYEGCTTPGPATLDLASAVGIGTLDATRFSYFSNITFSAGYSWDLIAGTANLNGSLINGFINSDTIELTSFAASSYSFSNNYLTLAAGSSYTTLNIVGDFSSSSFGVTTANGNSYITQLCFARGTKIATPGGEVNVEKLAVGDMVRTQDGKDEPIVWMGASRVQVTPGRRNATTPVIVHKGALAANVPHADLRLTKGHSLHLDGVLIPVECLVNHRSITWDDRAREIDIYHIELAHHAVLIANGASAESYRDDGNCWIFRNAGERWDRSPTIPCAPVLMGGPVVDAVWRRLLDRSGPRPGLPTTNDPDLHLLVDGERLDGHQQADGIYTFLCPNIPPLSGSSLAQVSQRNWALPVTSRLVFKQAGAQPLVIESSDPALQVGFHDFEENNGFRWTDGQATLPPALVGLAPAPCDPELHIGCTTTYPLIEDHPAIAA